MRARSPAAGRGSPAVVYRYPRYRDALYLNITNRCPTACVFCIKGPWKMDYRGYDLRLRGEPTPREVLAAVGPSAKGREVVFCGYGEATYRMDALKRICAGLRRRRVRRIRLTTVGLGDLINGRDISGELARRVDSVTVSLNTGDPRQWVRMHRPQPRFRERGFEAVLAFIRNCVRRGLDTTVTALAAPGVDRKAVRALARGLGVGYRLRPLLKGTRRSSVA